MNAVIIFLKYPTPGRVKTRLGAEIGHDLAAELYRKFIRLTVRLVRESGAERVYAAYDPAHPVQAYRRIVSGEVIWFPQRGEDLGQRMYNATEYALTEGADRVVIVGTDSPTLPARRVGEALRRLSQSDLVLGPAEDGGYYLIGLRRPIKTIFENVAWSSSSVLEATLARARAVGVRYELLSPWYDVDEVADLKRAVSDDATGALQTFVNQRPALRERLTRLSGRSGA